MSSEGVRTRDEDYPTGEFEFEKFGPWRSFLVKVKMLVAFPWERVRKGSVLTMKLRGQVLVLNFLLGSLIRKRTVCVSVFWFVLHVIDV